MYVRVIMRQSNDIFWDTVYFYAKNLGKILTGITPAGSSNTRGLEKWDFSQIARCASKMVKERHIVSVKTK